MNEWGAGSIEFMNTSPLFKGLAVMLVGALALYFSWWMKKKWREPSKGGWLVFTLLAVFIVLYGLFVLVFGPRWWNPPY